MLAKTKGQIYSESEELIVNKASDIKRTSIDSYNTPDMIQSTFKASYHNETMSSVFLEEAGNTIIKQEETSPSPKQTPKTNVTKKSELAGAVISIEEVSVVCEVYLNDSQDSTLTIRLPKILFPRNISYGSAITVAYQKDAYGIRRPSVTLRKITKSKRMVNEDREMEALVNNF